MLLVAAGLPKRDDALSVRLPARRARRRIQPLTWIVTVALMPVLLYDVWQTVQDVKQRHRVRAENITANLGTPAAARPPRY